MFQMSLLSSELCDSTSLRQVREREGELNKDVTLSGCFTDPQHRSAVGGDVVIY